ncbi:hypothetical protein APY04_3454 [Hyphomicrobium sulfonivorans]|uniref:HTH tetR-type domain-containing protein n=1 Tax=Hyphomicrobium sulfonivorans TaxID=121290 RepID=A0A109B8R8_HYPSL|nr:TetR/AcrR family transcriptional regulator [Hyphomicrobium sulfonivorans]KWT64190.1 hypothetical protein APY04_3454 [Hyphomicrobium sulfonivorans]
MIDQSTIKGRLVAAAIRLAAQSPWRDVTLTDIANSAGVSLVDLRNTFSSKGEVIAAFVRMIDDEVLAQTQFTQRGRAQTTEDGAPSQTSPRDALFEVIMARFDALGPYKAALRSIADSWTLDPAIAAAVARSQVWMLRAAGIGADGVEGRLRAGGLTGVYASVYRTWLTDDDPGLGKTMAVLDRRLRRGENVLKQADSAFGKLCGFARSCRGAVQRRSTTRDKAAANRTDEPTADDMENIPPGALS